jgi:large subunit ribosomal protein L28
MVGHHVSHANNKTKRASCRTCSAAVSGSRAKTAGQPAPDHERLRTIDKNGIEVVLAEMRAKGQHI